MLQDQTTPFSVAAITASELLHGVARANTPERRLKRSHYVEGVLQCMPVIDFALGIARRHAGPWAALGANGKLIGPYDMLIAATALKRGHSLATLNLDEFERVDGLDLLDVTPFVVANA